MAAAREKQNVGAPLPQAELAKLGASGMLTVSAMGSMVQWKMLGVSHILQNDMRRDRVSQHRQLGCFNSAPDSQHPSGARTVQWRWGYEDSAGAFPSLSRWPAGEITERSQPLFPAGRPGAAKARPGRFQPDLQDVLGPVLTGCLLRLFPSISHSLFPAASHHTSPPPSLCNRSPS